MSFKYYKLFALLKNHKYSTNKNKVAYIFLFL